MTRPCCCCWCCSCGCGCGCGCDGWPASKPPSCANSLGTSEKVKTTASLLGSRSALWALWGASAVVAPSSAATKSARFSRAPPLPEPAAASGAGELVISGLLAAAATARWPNQPNQANQAKLVVCDLQLSGCWWDADAQTGARSKLGSAVFQWARAASGGFGGRGQTGSSP